MNIWRKISTWILGSVRQRSLLAWILLCTSLEVLDGAMGHMDLVKDLDEGIIADANTTQQSYLVDNLINRDVFE